MRGHDIPQAAKNNTIRTYADLHRKFDLFLSGQITSNLLIIARSGVGKSSYLKKNADWRITALLEGNVKALKTYIKLYQNRHKLIVLDDAENLWESKNGRVVMRELTETSYPKTMSWESTAKELTETQTPTTYQTNSRACIICNSFRFGRTDETAAIIDRCQCYCFNPTNEEVARYVSDWFWDQTVFNYACENITQIDNLTARMFIDASDRHLQQDKDWRNEFVMLSGVDYIVQKICHDQHMKTSADQVQEFKRIATQNDLPSSRATFMRHKADLKARGMLGEKQPALKLKVKGSPPDVPTGVEAILAEVEAACMEDKYFGAVPF